MQINNLVIEVTTTLCAREVNAKLNKWVSYQELASVEDFSVCALDNSFEIMFTFLHGIAPQNLSNFAYGAGTFLECHG